MRALKTRALSCLVTAALLLTLLPGAVSAAGKTIYTDKSYTGVSDGSISKPYASFEDALKNAGHGDTIVIQGKAFANAREESGVSPLIIDKSVTITGEDGKTGELHVRAGGIILGADVTMTNVELNLANKYHNAIFVNGYRFTANNVTRGSISREVHLFAGGIGNGTQVTTALPAGGGHASLSLTDSTFGSIYAGGVMTGYAGDVTVTASDCRLGGVYGSGAQERAPDGNWFDTSEPPAPVADRRYAATGSVSIQTDADSIRTVDAMDSRQVSVAVNNALGSRVLRLAGVKTLTVNGGTATVAELDTAANVTVSNSATLNLAKMEAPTLGSLSGSGKLILEKTQTLTITGNFNGTWSFETRNGFTSSGVAEYSHTYITAGGGNADVRFTPHITQSSMTLDKGTNGWTTSAAPKISEVVTSFEIDGVPSKTLTVDELQKDSYTIPVKWTPPAADPENASLMYIPFRYEVTVDGTKYPGAAEREADDEPYSAWITLADGNVIWLDGTDESPYDDTTYNGIMISGNLAAGVYQIAIFAPCTDGTEIQQDFTLIVNENGSTKTKTTVAVTAQDAAFGDDFTASVSVAANGAALTVPAVEYWLNGKQVTLNDLKVLPDTFKLGTNELRVIYPGDADHEASVGVASFTVEKARNSRLSGFTPPSDARFDGKPHTGTLENAIVSANGTELDADPTVAVEYLLDSSAVSTTVFPGEYTALLKTAGTDLYDAFEQPAGTFTIQKATPTVTVTAAEQGSGAVLLTAAVSCVDAYFATGKVVFTWDGQTFEEPLSQGSATHTVTGAAAKPYTYRAAFVPQDDPYYLEASSEEKTFTPSAATGITISADADTITVSGGSAASATVIAAQYIGGRMTDVCVIQDVVLPTGGTYPMTLPTRSGATRTAFVLGADGTPLCAKQVLLTAP